MSIERVINCTNEAQTRLLHFIEGIDTEILTIIIIPDLTLSFLRERGYISHK